MWKKVGAIGPTSIKDNKSDRSQNQNPIEQPFSQMTKERMSESQIFFQGNDYFFNHHLKKVKDTDSLKHTSQQSIKFTKLSHAKSHKQLPSDYGHNQVKMKKLNYHQIQELSNRFNSDNFDTAQKNDPNTNADDKIKTTQSTEKIQSSTSIENNVKTLKQCRSTPQLNLEQFKTITEEIPLHKKIQTKKNIELLRKEHQEIKKNLETELNEFSNEFHSMQAEMANKLSRMITEKAQNNSAILEKQTTEMLNNKKMNDLELIPETKKFAEKLKTINAKKAELAQKYKSFRVK